jgi:phosphohistidine swiveling domain-containing protein
VNTMMPLVMALDDTAATPPVAGGKGASLARLARAGFAIPPGFHVTTRAYEDFVGQAGLTRALRTAAARVSPADPASPEDAACEIGGLFGGTPVPEAIAAAVAGAYRDLRSSGPAVAVRSSATAEDLATLSAAGQQDTYLNIRGDAELIDAVRRCWASLWTARAISYRARAGITAEQVSMAVVVQQFVSADAAGVLFTVDPAGGDPDRVVINAGWGLGEALVGGQVTPDVAVLSRVDGAIREYRVGAKQRMTVPADTGVREQDTEPGLRGTAVLSDAQASELARTGLAIEKLYGHPVDVEWARAGNQMFVLQARPVTSPVSPGERWNDSLAGDFLWSAGNLTEALPDVMTPATWSLMQLFMTRAISPPSVGSYHGYGRVGGRFYVNISMAASLSAALGVPARRYLALNEPVFGKLPPAADVPRVRLPRWKIIRQSVPAAVTLLRRARRNLRRLPGFRTAFPGQCDAVRAEVARIGDAGALAAIWDSQIKPLFLTACDMLSATGAGGAAHLLGVPARLAARVGQADAALLLSGQVPGQDPLASLGPALGAAQLARGEIDRATFGRQYGHRGTHEVEVSWPRPAEDPAWADRELASLAAAAHDAEELLTRQEAARAAAWDRLSRDPKKAAAARALVSRWAGAARAREGARSELARSFWVLRAWILRAGELTGCGDDLFFLSYQEILDVLRGVEASLGAVPGRRATYTAYRGLPAYPALIRGRFDPVSWAADPERRSDFYDERAAPASADTISGFPGGAGVVEGTVRLISDPADAARLEPGEILVTVSTNIGWTPLFPRAAAVVTDVGAPLSHATIVARELGIPAVVGCGNATMRLHSGDRIRVDGGKGTVELLQRAS